MSFLEDRRVLSILFDVATPVVHVGGPMALLPVKIPLGRSKCSRLCARAISSSSFFLFSSSPARGCCWLSRSTEVASNRIPAQQAIVRSKEIALQKYTESAACKKSKKTCLRGVCVDRSRLHFTVTDGRRTRRRRTRRRSLRWRKRGWRRLSPVDPRCIEIQREETYPP